MPSNECVGVCTTCWSVFQEKMEKPFAACSQAGPECEREGVFGGIAWERQKKARMNDCHWDSEGDVYGCHSRMNMGNTLYAFDQW